MADSVAVPARRSLLRPLIFGLTLTADPGACCSACRGGRWCSPARTGRPAVVVAGTIAVRRRAGRVPGADVPRARPPARDWAARDRRHHPRRDLGAVRLVAARQRAAARRWRSPASPTRPGPGSSPARSRWSSLVLLVLGVRRGDAGAPGARGSTSRSPGSAPASTALRVVLLTDTHYGPIDRARWSARVVDGGQRARRRHRLPHRRHRRRHGGRSAASRPRRSATSGPGWPGPTSPATTSTSARPRAGSTTCASWAGSRCTTGTSWSSATAPGWWWPASTTAPPARSGLARPPGRPRGRAGRRRPGPARAAAGPPAEADRRARSRTASTCRSPGTPTAARSGRSTSWCASTSRRSHGLSRHGDRTQLYTSRGTGFWGPPFRVFAPSEITLLTLRSAG